MNGNHPVLSRMRRLKRDDRCLFWIRWIVPTGWPWLSPLELSILVSIEARSRDRLRFVHENKSRARSGSSGCSPVFLRVTPLPCTLLFLDITLSIQLQLQSISSTHGSITYDIDDIDRLEGYGISEDPNLAAMGSVFGIG